MFCAVLFASKRRITCPRAGRDGGGLDLGNPIADAKLPLEALRTIHSFDPCLACAIHTVDAEGETIAQVKAL